MLALPTSLSDLSALTDWTELCCLVRRSKSISFEDIIGELKRVGEDNPEREEHEATIDSAFQTPAEDIWAYLDSRSKRAQSGYPFTLDDARLILRTDAPASNAYCFALVCARLPHDPNGADLFEDLCAGALSRYSGARSKVIRFGSPRRDPVPTGFSDAVEYVSRQCCEGEGAHIVNTRNDTGDESIDLVAWKPFPDELTGRLMLVGSCASGKDWVEKRLSEPRWDTFADYMLSRPAVSATRMFFTTHCLDEPIEWAKITRQSRSIMMDRCRIAAVMGMRDTRTINSNLGVWCRSGISRLASTPLRW